MPGNGLNLEDPDSDSLLSVRSIEPCPDTLTKLIRRLRAMTLTLLPLEVEPEAVNDPTSRIITPQVITTYIAAAGDFVEALPYCLLKARTQFMWDANHNPADYGENFARATACEVLARRIVHISPPDRLTAIMSTRYKHRQLDGDESEMSSALELAIDSHCAIFLSSSEAQGVINDIWRGTLVQKNNKHHDIDYVYYEDTHDGSFWRHLDPTRLSVPRYQNMFRIIVWLFFLFAYSQAVREPLEKLDQNHLAMDEWEVILYVMAFSFIFEDGFRFYKLLRFVTWRAFNFWSIVSFATNTLLLSAFVLRVIGLFSQGDQLSTTRLRSFQVLSFVAPLIWMKLVTIFDGMKYIGTMQICVARMLRESGIFFALLSVLGLGFAQGLYALDAADGETEAASVIVNVLVQALLQSPNFDKFALSPAGLYLYYFWNVVTAIILLNVLISLFSSAYSDVVDDAEAQYLAFFAGKTVSMIRAPDSFVYPAPFNLFELFFIAPFEKLGRFSMGPETYAKYNRYVMSVIFIVPLTLIALYEAMFDDPRNSWMKNWLTSDDQGEDDSPKYRDPEVSDEEEGGLKISKVPFTELIKAFPDTQASTEATIMKEIQSVKQQMSELMKMLEAIKQQQ